MMRILGSLAIVLALTGCATMKGWFGETSSSTETTATARPSSETPTATPASVTPQPPATTPVETAAVPAPSSNGFHEMAGLTDVRFRSGQVGVVRADYKLLDGVVRWMKENPSAVVMVEGHTDDQGNRDENLAVGEKRASSVMRYLIARGVEASRVTVASVGSDRPACAEKTDACRAKNRRARFLVRK
jgi:peptidoglycan-associated lipoprotein